MRKSLFLTIVLLVLSAAALCFVNSWVGQDKDAVVIDETVLLGDKAKAAGIAINCRAHCDYHLFWDTVYTIGEGATTNTDFAFSQSEKRFYNMPFNTGIMFDGTFGNYGMSSAAGGLSMEDQASPVQAVASRTAAGKEHTEEVYIKDYYDYYPIYATFSQAGFRVGENDQTQKILADYFKIPVYEAHRVKITIVKDTAGKTTEIGMEGYPDSSVYIYTNSVVADTGCYFTLSCRAQDGNLLDTSQIAGGYGIYYIPYSKENDITVPDAAALDMVFAVDAARADIITLRASADQSKLLLVTKEAQACMLTVLDKETMLPLQKLELLALEADEVFWDMHVYDDFIVTLVGDGRMALLAVNAAGYYELQFTANFDDFKELLSMLSSNVAMDYDGERLAVSAFQNYNTCGFYLAVFDRTGLVYAGKYNNSLDISLAYDATYRCRPAEAQPLSVTWRS